MIPKHGDTGAGHAKRSGGAVGDVRFPAVAQLDFNLRRAFKFGGRVLTPRFEVFNALNNDTITASVSQLGPTYRRPSLIQHGRLYKFEVGFDF
jgi:hypothetical protein